MQSHCELQYLSSFVGAIVVGTVCLSLYTLICE